MGQQVHQHVLPNGLVLLAERMDHVRSVAVNFLVQAGAAFDPQGQFGVASALAELMTRGAGPRDSRALSLALDNLGVDRGESAGIVNLRLGGSTLGRNLLPMLDIYADILLRPRLPDDELEPVQEGLLQDIKSLEDSPQGKVMVELHRRYYPNPLNRDRRGKPDDIQALTPDAVRAHYRRFVRPNKAIISVAGNIDWDALKARVEKLFGRWEPGEEAELVPGEHTPQSAHLEKDSAQTQIAFAYPSVPLTDPDYFPARAAEGVLSGGMSARLFTEVREKRGLCYSVGVRHETFRDRGTMVGYAGTGPDRAQQTLDVTLAEVRKLKDGVTGDEIDRVKAGLKSSLIMAEESTGARASTIASDWYFLGRVRSMDEIQAAIDGLTPAAVMAHLERHPLRGVTLVTLGQHPLTIPA